ncbi:MAG: hypothetical protein MUO54_06460, partial [Anaerolineales bacterium]|nr:hypothetical protein [Anaerolineales bacterium]
MKELGDVYRHLHIGQWVLLGIAVLTGLGGGLLGVSDNPPAIFLVVTAVACLAGSAVWNWRSPRKFWILLGSTLLAFPIGVFLHNMFYALGTLVSDIAILGGLVDILGVVFFI